VKQRRIGHQTSDLRVGGSNPSGRASFLAFLGCQTLAHALRMPELAHFRVAHLHWLYNDEALKGQVAILKLFWPMTKSISVPREFDQCPAQSSIPQTRGTRLN
jgi:hypothetical protein